MPPTNLFFFYYCHCNIQFLKCDVLIVTVHTTFICGTNHEYTFENYLQEDRLDLHYRELSEENTFPRGTGDIRKFQVWFNLIYVFMPCPHERW